MQRRPSVSRSTTDLTETEEGTGPRRSRRATAGQPPTRFVQQVTTATRPTQRQRPLHGSQSVQDLRKVNEDQEPTAEEPRPTPEDVRQLQAQYTHTQVFSNSSMHAVQANEAINNVANLSLDELLRRAGLAEPLPITQRETQNADNTLLQPPGPVNASTPATAPSTVDQGTVEVAEEAINESRRWLEENSDPADIEEPEIHVTNASSRSSPPRRERRARSALDNLRIQIGDLDELIDPDEELERYGAPSQMSQHNISYVGDRRKLDLTVPSPDELADELLAVTVVIPHPNTITPDFRDRLERFLKHRGIYIDVNGSVMALLAAFANTVVKELTDRFSRTINRRKNEFERERASLQDDARNAFQDAARAEEQEERSHAQLTVAVGKMQQLQEIIDRLSELQDKYEQTIQDKEAIIREMEGHATTQNGEIEDLRSVNNINQARIRDLTTQTEGLQQGVHRDSATDADVKRAQELLQQHTQGGMQPNTVSQIITLIQRMQVRIAAQAKTITDREAEVRAYEMSQKDLDATATSAKEKLKAKEKELAEYRQTYLREVSDHRIKIKELQLRHNQELDKQTKEMDTIRTRYNQLCDTEHKLREDLNRAKEEQTARIASARTADDDTRDLTDRLTSISADLQGQVNMNKHLTDTITEHEETIARMRVTTTFPATEAIERAKKAEEALGQTQKKLDMMSNQHEQAKLRYDNLVAARTHCTHEACCECNLPMVYNVSTHSSLNSVYGPEVEGTYQKSETESHDALPANTLTVPAGTKPKPATIKLEKPPTIEELFKMPTSEVLKHRGSGIVHAFDTVTPLVPYKGEANANPWEWGERLIERITERTQNVSSRVNMEATAVLYIRRTIHNLISDTAKGFHRLYIEDHPEELDFFELLGYLAKQLPHKPKRLPQLDDIKQKPHEGVDDFFSALVLLSEKLYPEHTDEVRNKRALAVAQHLAKNCKESYRRELGVKMNNDVEEPAPGESNLQFRQRMITALRGIQTLDPNYSNDARKQLLNSLESQLRVNRAEAREEPSPGNDPGQRGRTFARDRGLGNRPTRETAQRERQETIQSAERTTRYNPQRTYRTTQGGDRQGQSNRQFATFRYGQRAEAPLLFQALYPNPMQAADGSNIIHACYNCFQGGHKSSDCAFDRRHTVCIICGHNKGRDPHPLRECATSRRQPMQRRGQTWMPIGGHIIDWDRARQNARPDRGTSNTYSRQINQVTIAGQDDTEGQLEEEVQRRVNQEEEINRRVQQRINAFLTENLPNGGQPEGRIQAMMVDSDSPNGDDNHWSGTHVCVGLETGKVQTTLIDVGYQPTWGPQEMFAHLKHEVVKGRPKCAYKAHPSKAMCAAALKQTASLARMTNAATLDYRVPATHAEFDQLVREGKSILHLEQSESPIVFYNKQGLPVFQTPGLIDTGANVSIFPYGALEALGLSDKDIFGCRHKHILGVGGHKLTLRGCVTIPFRLANKVPIYHTFHVLNPSEFTTSMFIIGADCLENITPAAYLDTKNRKILIGEHKIPWGNQVRNLKAPVMLAEDIKFGNNSETQMARVSVDEWCYSTDRPDSDLAMVIEPSVKQQQTEPRVLRGIHKVQEHPYVWTHIYKPRGSKEEWKEGDIIGWATLTPEDCIKRCETVIPEDAIDRACGEAAYTPVIAKVKAVLADALRPQVLPPLSPDPYDQKSTDPQEPVEHFFNDELWFRKTEAQEAALPDVMPSEILIPKDDYDVDEEFVKLGGGKIDDWVADYKEKKPIQPPTVDSIDWTRSILNEKQQDELKHILNNNLDAFGSHLSHLQRTTATEMSIETTNNYPIRTKAYMIGSDRKKWFDDEIDMLLELKVIEPSYSQHAAPVVVAKKKGTDKWRLCCDYRKLNEVTKFDAYPAHNVRMIFDTLKRGVKYFASMDLMSGFWQINLKKEDRPKTAFTSHRGLLQWCVMPFGLKNSPACFQRLMDIVFKEMIGAEHTGVFVYVDDVLLYCDTTFEDFCDLVDRVCKRLIQFQLKAKLNKCEFGLETIRFLGHEITKEGIRPDTEKCKAIMDLEPPITVKDLKSFLGMVTYYMMFVPGFAFHAVHLYQLTRGTTKSDSLRQTWNHNAQFAYDYIKYLVCQRTLLYFPDLNKKFYINTDASDYGVGAELWQVGLDGYPVTVAWISKVFTQSMLKFSVTEKEGYALVFALTKFRPFLQGRRFVVYTDHKALVSMMKLKDPYRRIMRWMSFLQEFTFDVIFVRGRDNIVADALSRLKRRTISTDEANLRSLAGERGAEAEHFTRVDLMDSDGEGSVIHMYSINTENFSPINRHEIDEAKNELARLVRQKTALLSMYMPDGQSAFLTAQLKDEFCRNIKRRMDGTSHEQRNSARYVTVDNVLYRTTKSGRMTLVVPYAMKGDILYGAHDSLFAGHLGVPKTTARLEEKYYWPKMRQDVVEHIQGCQVCQRNKPGKPQVKERPLMRPVRPGRPFETIGVDCMGPLKPTPEGYRHIILFIDHFTKWAEAAPLKDLQADTVVQALTELIILRHGTPIQIVSDNARYFTAEFTREVMKLLHIEQRYGPPYRPEAQGQVEVSNRTIKQILRAYTNYQQDDWNIWLPFAVHAYRTSWCAAIKDSPFTLVHGRPCINPTDVNFGIQRNIKYMDVVDYKRYIYTFMRFAHRAADIAIQETQEKYRHAYDKDKKPGFLKEGDPCWIMVPNRKKITGNQLGPLWVGPVRIIQRDGPRAEIQFEDAHKRREKPFWVYAGYLKKYFPPINKQRITQTVTPEEWRRIAVGEYGSAEIDPTTPLPTELQLPELNPDEEPLQELGDDSEHLVTDEHAMFEQIHEDIVSDNKRGIARRTGRKRAKPDRYQAA